MGINDLEATKLSIRHAIEHRRQAIIFDLAKKLDSRLAMVCENYRVSEDVDERSWIQVESLSGLRAEVGGRFKNLKDKWVEAGLPLREHRGDRSGTSRLHDEGWIVLSMWINKRGYEVRLANESENYLFEIRKADTP